MVVVVPLFLMSSLLSFCYSILLFVFEAMSYARVMTSF